MDKQKTPKQKVTFTYAAPEAESVLLAGDFTGWQQAPLSLKKDKTGTWKKTVSLAPGSYQYRLLVDGEWQDDPHCTNRQTNQFGGENCVCVVNGAQVE
jgi:5'-AMP-activated protein kinase regulatory beta subunit